MFYKLIKDIFNYRSLIKRKNMTRLYSSPTLVLIAELLSKKSYDENGNKIICD